MGQGFHRQIGMDGFGAITRQHGEMVHFTRGTGFDHQTGGGAQTSNHQVLVNGGQGQQGRNGNLGSVDVAVADDQDVLATLDRIHGFGAQRSQLGLHTLMAPGQRVGYVQRVAAELALGMGFDVAQLGHVGKVQHRLGHFQTHGRVDLVDVQQVRLGADKGHQRHHDGFADRVDRRIGHLGKQLLEVVVQRLVLVGQHGQRAVVAHGANRLFPGGRHGGDQELQVFLGKAKGLLAIQQRHLVGDALGLHTCHHFGKGRVLALFGNGHVVELDAQVFDPLFVGLAVGQVGLELLVVNHATLFQIDQEHLAGLQPPFAHDLVFRHRQNAGFGAHDHQIVIGDAVA